MNIKLFLTLTSVLFLTISTQAAVGELDCSFGTRGKTTTALGGLSSDIALDVVVQPDEKVVVVGFRGTNSGPSDSVVIRYHANGTLDTSFDSDGILILPVSPTSVDEARSVVIQPDGKIVVAGYAYNDVNTAADFYVLRLNSNGSFDTTFGIGGKVLTDFNGKNDYGYSVVIQPDGKIVVGGSVGDTTGNRLRFGVVRYNPDGSLDTEFGNGGRVQTIFFNFDNNIFVDIKIKGDKPKMEVV